MRNIKITIKKELRAIIRDKKSLLMMALTPLFIPLFVILMAYVYDFMTREGENIYSVGVNYNLSDIENKFAKNSGVNRKFYCLSVKDWTEEKKKYMELLKNKQNNFVYIDEEDKDFDSKSVASASDLFGESLLEIE